MDFDHYGPSRDLLYVTFLLLGGAVGSALMRLRKNLPPRHRARWISALLYFASAALAALAASVILSDGRVFTVSSHYPFVLFFFALGAAALRFPRAGGCTAIFAAGLFAVWLCLSFLVFPPFETPVQLSLRFSGGELLIRRGASVRESRGVETRREAETWNVPGDTALNFEAAALTAHPSYPLIGGERRGLITRVTRNGEQLFALTGGLYRLRFSGGLGFSLDHYRLELPAGTLPQGTSVSLLFDGRQLYFDPPIHLSFSAGPLNP